MINEKIIHVDLHFLEWLHGFLFIPSIRRESYTLPHPFHTEISAKPPLKLHQIPFHNGDISISGIRT